MKKLSILALAAVGLLVTACSTNDAVSEAQNPNSLEGMGQGFLSVNVNLPVKTTGSTRVDADGKGDWSETTRLEDGDPKEYKVDDVLLVIFGGESESAATVKQLWSPTAVGTWGSVDDDPNQVTTRNKYVVKLDEGIEGPFWILAVVNSHGIIKPGTTANTIVVNNESYDFSRCTLSTLQGAKVTADAEDGTTPFMNNTDKNGFFMTNAVFSDQQGGHTDANVKALVLAPVAKIYESESAAEAATAAPSADIYVERGLAKVTVSAGEIEFDGSVRAANGDDLKDPELAGWVLDNTNMTSFVVRNAPDDEARSAEWGFYSRGSMAGIDKFRFVGYNNVDVPKASGDQTSPSVYTQSTYRTYWSPDPNYSVAYNKTNFFEPETKTFPADGSKPQYCFENTFDVAHQSYENTTRVVAKVTLNAGGTFYTIGGDRKTLYQLEDVKNAIYARILLNDDFQLWATDNITQTTTIDKTVFASVTFDKDARTAGTIKITDVTINATNGAVKMSEDNGLQAILEEAKTYIGRIQQYPGGTTYYAIRIKHFGDDLTPWGWNGEAESTIATIYPAGNANVGTAEENYLGRYGVLRNNWYELSLDKILKIGHPIVPWLNPDNDPNPDPENPDNPNPEDPDHPDDSLDDSYISARINILSWAKRPQGVILK